MISTLNSALSSAELCRQNNWQVGTQLIGADEGYGSTVIQITAIGEKKIFVKTISHNGVSPPYSGYKDHETSWFLAHREWKPLSKKSFFASLFRRK